MVIDRNPLPDHPEPSNSLRPTHGSLHEVFPCEHLETPRVRLLSAICVNGCEMRKGCECPYCETAIPYGEVASASFFRAGGKCGTCDAPVHFATEPE